MSAPFLRVRSGEQELALDVRNVLEVAEYRGVTPVPGAPSHLLGMTNLRGQLLAVVDLARLLGASEPDPHRLVVLEAGTLRASVIVSEAHDVEPLPGRIEPTEAPLLSGAVLLDGELVGVIDVPAALARAAGQDA